MNRTLRFAGLVLASLTISTVAMAQQGGGGRGGDGGAGGNSGDKSVLEVLREDHDRARLSRAVEPRRGASNCITAACEQPPSAQVPQRERIAQFEAVCAGGDVMVLRRTDGRTIRYVCRNL